MSCSRQCFDENDEWFGHDDCHTCPGRDDGRKPESTNICQNSTKLVETEQSQSADLSSKTPTTHRYTGSFGE